MIVGGYDLDWQIPVDDRTYDLRELHERVVLVAHVPHLTVDLLVRELEQSQIYCAHVIDVQIWPLLISTENLDASLVDREIGQNIYDHIEPLPRRAAANRCGAERTCSESWLAFLGQHGLTHRLVLRIVRQWFEREILADFGLALYAVDARRRRIDEASDPGT